MRENVSNNISVKAMCLISLISKDNLTKYNTHAQELDDFPKMRRKEQYFDIYIT